MNDNVIIDLSNVNENVLEHVKVSFKTLENQPECVSELIKVDKVIKKLSGCFNKQKMISDEFFIIQFSKIWKI